MFPILDVADVFLMIRLGLWLWGIKPQRRSPLMNLTCYYWRYVISTWHFSDELDHLMKVVFARFLHCNVSSFSFPFLYSFPFLCNVISFPFLYSLLWLQITESSPFSKGRGLSSTSWREHTYLQLLEFFCQRDLSPFSWMIFLRCWCNGDLLNP